ncbi:hypothetical protein Zmor_009475 [Zophobas morio]|uniref:Uncharacterized protein n=1 Tax=Zophobas morio TaxID=2755281 RepID=A0AA38IGW0_9CUCU|nr:hypothetical protein Zmor_009475 [Zophobas morio]
MGKNNCCILFCVGAAIFIDIVGGLVKIIDSSVNSKQVDSGTLAGQIVLSLVFLLSGILLLVGAIKRKPSLILAHVIIETILLVLAVIGVIIIGIFLAATVPLALVMLIIVVIILILRAGLEYAVYVYYKNMKSEFELGAAV